MNDFQQEGNDEQQPIKPTEIGKKPYMKAKKAERRSAWFWRKKITEEVEQDKKYEYFDENENLQEKQKKEQQKQVAVDIDRKSTGKSPPVVMNQSELGTDILSAPKGEKKKKMSFKKLIKRSFIKNKKKR